MQWMNGKCTLTMTLIMQRMNLVKQIHLEQHKKVNKPRQTVVDLVFV